MRPGPTASGRATPPLVEAKIVDVDGNEVETGEIGEICFKSPANMRLLLGTTPGPRTKSFCRAAGSAPETSGLWMKRASSSLRTGPRTWSFGAGKTSPVAKSRTRSANILLFSRPRFFGLPEERLGEQVAAVIQVRPEMDLDRTGPAGVSDRSAGQVQDSQPDLDSARPPASHGHRQNLQTWDQGRKGQGDRCKKLIENAAIRRSITSKAGVVPGLSWFPTTHPIK